MCKQGFKNFKGSHMQPILYLTRMHSSRMCTARGVSASGSGECQPPYPLDTPFLLKILPCPKLLLRAVLKDSYFDAFNSIWLTCLFQDRKSCCGAAAGSEFAYYTNRRLRVPYGTPIYECNKLCKCGPDCPNRVVQKGRKVKVRTTHLFTRKMFHL